MKVLLSIKPQFAEEILNGKKKYEYRKSIFKDKNVSKILLYATKPIGKIIGEFAVDSILREKPETLWFITHESAGISKEYFQQYFSGRSFGYAIKVKNPKRYHQALNINDVTENSCVPQSFAYVR